MRPKNIAVIGSGISGLSAAWLLDKQHNVTLFETNSRLGGHTNTVNMRVDGATVAVDTGFICFNEQCYPNLTAMFQYLGVPVHRTAMSFSASLNAGAYEYSGGTYLGILGQPSNLFKPAHWRMVTDILRFFKEAPKSLVELSDSESLADYLVRQRYSTEFCERHLLPMAAAIWSSKLGDMLEYPARSFIRFFQNHGLLQVDGRPKWGTVDGGAKQYIDLLLQDGHINLRLGQTIECVERRPDCVLVTDSKNCVHRFDQIVIATHADQALSVLDSPSIEERSLLSCFSYSKNHAVLHRDKRLMPKRKAVWASWNYLDFRTKGNVLPALQEDLCVTYWMNSLQNLQTKKDVFVTLNPPKDLQIDQVAETFDYMHPVFDAAAMRAQRQLWSLQGQNRTWFCGAHFGAGFHEDGLQSGLAVAEQLGGSRRPWNVENESERIFLDTMPILQEAAE